MTIIRDKILTEYAVLQGLGFLSWFGDLVLIIVMIAVNVSLDRFEPLSLISLVPGYLTRFIAECYALDIWRLTMLFKQKFVYILVSDDPLGRDVNSETYLAWHL